MSMMIPTREGFASNIRYWRRNLRGQFESIHERNLQCVFAAMRNHQVPKNRERVLEFMDHLKKR